MSLVVSAEFAAAVVVVTAALAWSSQPWLRSWAGLPVLGRRAVTPVGVTALTTLMACATVGSLRPGLLALALLAVLSPLFVEADLTQRRLPVVLTRPAVGVSALTFAVDGVAGGTVQRTAGAAGVGLVSWAVFAAVRVVSRGGMGRGDVTLAGLLGLQLGWLGLGTAALGFFLAFALAATSLLPAIAVGAVSRHAKVPFGPFLLLGAWSAVAAAGTLAIAEAVSVTSWVPLLVLLTVAVAASRSALSAAGPLDPAVTPPSRRLVLLPGRNASTQPTGPITPQDRRGLGATHERTRRAKWSQRLRVIARLAWTGAPAAR